MNSSEDNTSQAILQTLKKASRNYPGGIPLRLLVEEEVVAVEDVKPVVQKKAAVAGSPERIVMLISEQPAAVSAIREFAEAVALKGLKLSSHDFAVLDAAEFAANFDKYSDLRFIVAFGLKIYNIIYAGQNLGSAGSLNAYRGVPMMIADQAQELINNPAKKKVFWENLKTNVIDKKII